jgi:L-ascorbate metabolism protein UlaG (beta-lactamase superfamily)
MKVTFYGHSTFLVDTGSHKIIFDPFITPNPAAAGIDASKIKVDFILLSHAHFDHVIDVELLLEHNPEATIIANAEIAGYYQAKGFKNAHGMNSGGKFAFPFGEVRMTQAKHSSTFPDGSSGGHPNGFIVTTSEKKFYYSGDTSLFGDMKLLGELYAPEVAFLSIGDNYTMGPAEGAIAASYLGVKKAVGMHFDTMPSIAIDHTQATALFDGKGVALHLPTMGETFDI